VARKTPAIARAEPAQLPDDIEQLFADAGEVLATGKISGWGRDFLTIHLKRWKEYGDQIWLTEKQIACLRKHADKAHPEIEGGDKF